MILLIKLKLKKILGYLKTKFFIYLYYVIFMKLKKN